MGAVAVEDEVNLEVVGHLLLDAPEEPLELRRPVTAVQRADHLAGGHVQGGEEAGGAVAHVVVAAPLRGAGHHRRGSAETG